MTYQYVKANLTLNPIWMYILLVGTILATNTSTLPPILTLFIITLSFVINQFYYDQRAYIHRFLISLPMPKKSIVQSRYISVIFIILLYVLIQWLLGFTGVEMHYAFHWEDVIAVISLQFVLIAIVIPLFYLIPSFIIAAGTIIVMMIFGLFYFVDALVSILGLEEEIIFNDLDPGLVLLVEKYIPYQPYLILVIVSIAFLYLSVKLSTYIFSLRNH